MAFVNPFQKKSWKNRIVEFAGRRKLIRVSGDLNTGLIVDTERAEGEISQDGDAFSKSNMDDLESRIENAFDKQPEWVYDETGKITGYKTKAGADTEFPFSSGKYKTAQSTNITWSSVNNAGERNINFYIKNPDLSYIIIISGGRNINETIFWYAQYLPDIKALSGYQSDGFSMPSATIINYKWVFSLPAEHYGVLILESVGN